MANEDNLRPVRTEEEAREKGTKGGIASGRARRRKKAMKERLQEALELNVINPDVKELMWEIGMEDGSTNYDAVTASIVKGAIRGLPGYARLLMELIGETGEEKRAEKADRRDAKRLRMEEEEFKHKYAGNTEDNDMVLEFIKGMQENGPTEQKTD
ncbi:hypothetical protein [Bilifractor porci]|uniref:Uncharacterized protein n=1 Tax=Bilifractor porci TaxID=2606636 RepID=A0A7X2P9V3_9FIRM|nr:hypothetical protein [Bilifractor porci]MST82864.1 hypothetical protein [Bilifractor porci]